MNFVFITTRLKEMSNNIILLGRAGVGKSTIASMLCCGYLVPNNNPFEIDDGVRGVTLNFENRVSKSKMWNIYDTIGLGESILGNVPHQIAQQRIVEFLKKVKTKFTYICIVKSKDRIDELDPLIIKATTEIFKGAESNFVLIVTHANNTWLNKERSSLVEVYGNIPMFAVDFPPALEEDENDEDGVEYEKMKERKRTNSFHALENWLESLKFKPVKPDIYDFTDEQIMKVAKKVLNILIKISEIVGPVIVPAVKLAAAGSCSIQ